MSQNFFVAENQSGSKGVSVPREQTVQDIEDIITGKYDHVDAEKFLYIGSARVLKPDGESKSNQVNPSAMQQKTSGIDTTRQDNSDAQQLPKSPVDADEQPTPDNKK